MYEMLCMAKMRMHLQKLISFENLASVHELSEHYPFHKSYRQILDSIDKGCLYQGYPTISGEVKSSIKSILNLLIYEGPEHGLTEWRGFQVVHHNTQEPDIGCIKMIVRNIRGRIN
jgi:hypothetical protein